jgi:NitT/TauT family transport system permease protein/sulfonate transport system permease protein
VRVGRFFLSLASLTLFCLLWEGASRTGVISNRLIPAPTEVAQAAWELINEGILGRDVYWSVRRALTGLVTGSLLGIIVGLFTGRVLAVRLLLEPVIQVLRPIPGIAWIPFAILWFGVGEVPKLFIISLGVFFPVWLSTHVGVIATRSQYVEAAQSLGAGKRELFYRVVLPATLPSIVTGLRQGLAIAFILVVAAELTGASSGLGNLISQSHLIFRTDRMLVGLALLGVLGALVDFGFSRLARWIVHWD